MKQQERLWYVVQTNIKCEERATKSLRAAGYRVYMPKMKKTITHHRTKKRIDRYFTLFNRYIFVGISSDNLDFGNVRKCDGVETILGIEMDRKPCRIPRDVILDFVRAQRRGAFNEIDAKSTKDAAKKRFTQGSTIRVRYGQGYNHPFGGFYGQVLNVKGGGVIRAMMSVFGGLVPVEFKPSEVEPVKDAA